MNDEVTRIKEKNLKEDKKAWKPFIIMMAVSLLAGGAGGYCSAMIRSMGLTGSFTQLLKQYVTILSAYIPLLVTLCEAVLYYIYNGRGRKLWNSGENGNEDVLNAIEENISKAMMAVGICQIFAYTFMVAFAGSLLETENTFFRVMVSLGGIILNIILSVYFQKELVNFEKELNPEKRGSALDKKFQDKWLESCDEMEKSQIYESAYAAYMAVGKTCLILLVLCMFGMMMFHMAVECVFIVGLIWLVQTVSYYARAMKLSKR